MAFVGLLDGASGAAEAAAVQDDRAKISGSWLDRWKVTENVSVVGILARGMVVSRPKEAA